MLTHQLTPKERIAFLTEFVCKASLPPSTIMSPPAVSPLTSAADSQCLDTTHKEPTRVSPSDTQTHAHDTVATPHINQNVSRLPKWRLPPVANVLRFV